MPAIMFVSDPAVPIISSMDNALQTVTFSRDTTFTTGQAGGDCSTRVCYEINHENVADVPKGTAVSLRIQGTNNQDSVRKAGDFRVMTQLYEIASPSNFYGIDQGVWPSDFTTTPGAVTSTTGKVMDSTTWVTYADNAAYTIYFTTYEYIPKNGILKLEMPDGVTITSSPVSGFSTTASGLGYSTHQPSYLELKAASQVKAGAYELKWGGIKNPRSTAPTNIFNISITDEYKNEVATGSIDTIRMKTPGTFKVLSVTPKALVVGATTDYEVSLTAAIPINNKD